MGGDSVSLPGGGHSRIRRAILQPGHAVADRIAICVGRGQNDIADQVVRPDDWVGGRNENGGCRGRRIGNGQRTGIYGLASGDAIRRGDLKKDAVALRNKRTVEACAAADGVGIDKPVVLIGDRVAIGI